MLNLAKFLEDNAGKVIALNRPWHKRSEVKWINEMEAKGVEFMFRTTDVRGFTEQATYYFRVRRYGITIR